MCAWNVYLGPLIQKTLKPLTLNPFTYPHLQAATSPGSPQQPQFRPIMPALSPVLRVSGQIPRRVEYGSMQGT